MPPAFVPVFSPPFDTVMPLLGDDPIDATLLNRTPVTASALAAVVVRARVIRREMWVEKAEIARASAEALPTDVPPPPTDFIARTYRVRKPEPLAAEQRCSYCDPIKIGWVACAACGRGQMPFPGGGVGPCALCESGFVPCSACEGTGRTVAIDVGVINDVELSVAQAYLPSVDRSPAAFAWTAALRAMLEGTTPDASLEISLAPDQQTSAYRGVVKNLEPIFHGHRYEDALVQARAELQGLSRRGPIVYHRLATYAWPYFWLAFVEEPRWIALVVRPDGKLAMFVPEVEPPPDVWGSSARGARR